MPQSPPRILVLLFWTVAVGLRGAPLLSVSFPFQLYRSGEHSACLYDLRTGLGDDPVDLCAVVTFTDDSGARAIRFAGPDGTLAEQPVRYREAVSLTAGQSSLGDLRQPVFSKDTVHPVSWWLYALPAGSDVESLARIAARSLNQVVPTRTLVAAQAFSRPWERFGFLQSLHLAGGMRLRAEISEEGRRFRCAVGPLVPTDFWALPGAKLILVAGLGCGARAWVGDTGLFVHKGQVDYRRRGILCDPELTRHYRHVAVFEYPSSGDLGGPEIADALKAVMRDARPEDRIDMLGHSMGGVVVRHFVEAEGGHRVVDNAVLLQSPLDGLSNGVHTGLANLMPGSVLDGALGKVSPLSKMLRGSAYLERLNAPWRRNLPPTSPTGYGTCRYYCIAAGVHGSGADRTRAAGWFDRQSDAFPTEIRATSALWLPLGGGSVGEIDPTGVHELLLVSPAPDQDRFTEHVSFIFHMADEERNGASRWLRERLWPAARP